MNLMTRGAARAALAAVAMALAPAAGAQTTDGVLSRHIREADGTSGQDTNSGAGVKTGHLQNGAVTAAKLGAAAVGTAALADGAVTAAKLAPGVLDSVPLPDGAVTAPKLAPGAVGTAAIADGSVTAPKIAAGAVSSAAMADGAVTAGKLAAGAVGTPALADAAVTTSKIGQGAVGTWALGDGAVTAPKLGRGSVGSWALEDGAVTSSKIGVGAVTTDALLDYAVGASKLAPGAVYPGALAGGAVGTGALADGAVTGPKLAHGYTFVVSTGADGQFSDLREAVAHATTAAYGRPFVIKLMPGTYYVDGPIDVPQQATIQGCGRTCSTIMETNYGPALRMNAGSTIADLALWGGVEGNPSSQGALYIERVDINAQGTGISSGAMYPYLDHANVVGSEIGLLVPSATFKVRDSEISGRIGLWSTVTFNSNDPRIIVDSTIRAGGPTGANGVPTAAVRTEGAMVRITRSSLYVHDGSYPSTETMHALYASGNSLSYVEDSNIVTWGYNVRYGVWSQGAGVLVTNTRFEDYGGGSGPGTGVTYVGGNGVLRCINAVTFDTTTADQLVRCP